METEKKKIGNKGEALAEEYLSKKGFQVLEKNYRAGRNEIDLIALDGTKLVFIEVKARKNSNFCEGREAVNRKKQVNIYKVAKAYISKQKISYKEIRFDVVEIYNDNNTLEHYEGAF